MVYFGMQYTAKFGIYTKAYNNNKKAAKSEIYKVKL